MAKTLELPALGNSMEEGTITQWFKAEGESVGKGEALYEVMTDKVNMEVESPEAGILRKILAPVDATVPVNNPVAILGTADEDISGLLGGTEPLPGASADPPLLGKGTEGKAPPPQFWGTREEAEAGKEPRAGASSSPSGSPELGRGGPFLRGLKFRHRPCLRQSSCAALCRRVRRGHRRAGRTRHGRRRAHCRGGCGGLL